MYKELCNCSQCIFGTIVHGKIKLEQELMTHLNNSLFIFMCILKDLPQGHYDKGAPPILYVPMFPSKYFIFTKQKKSKEMKRILFR
jgi:hypothetical protein